MDAEMKRFAKAFPPPDYFDFMQRLGWPEAKLKRDFRIGPGMKVHDFSELGLLDCPFRLVWECEANAC